MSEEELRPVYSAVRDSLIGSAEKESRVRLLFAEKETKKRKVELTEQLEVRAQVFVCVCMVVGIVTMNVYVCVCAGCRAEPLAPPRPRGDADQAAQRRRAHEVGQVATPCVCVCMYE